MPFSGVDSRGVNINTVEIVLKNMADIVSVELAQAISPEGTQNIKSLEKKQPGTTGGIDDSQTAHGIEIASVEIGLKRKANDVFNHLVRGVMNPE